jgi:hypothetical protein
MAHFNDSNDHEVATDASYGLFDCSDFVDGTCPMSYFSNGRFLEEN